MKLSLSNLRILPRWIVFFIDLVCVYLAIFIGFLLRFNFDLPHIASYHWSEIILCAGIVYTFCFIAFRTFSGIVRHTGTQDALRVLITLITASVIFILLNSILSLDGAAFLLPYSVICISLFSAFVLMLTYRLLVKATFDQVANPSGVVRSRVVIYGAGRAGLATSNILRSQSPKKNAYKIIAFVDDNPHFWGTQLDGVKIYSPGLPVLEKLYKKYSFNKLVVTEPLQKNPNKEAVLEWCLKNKIKILQTPPESQWMQSGLSIRQIRDIPIEDLLNREVIAIENNAVTNELKGKVILVTGAAGSIGSELVRQMAAFSPARIILCDQAESPLHDLLMEIMDNYPGLKIHTFLGDICNRSRMKVLFEKYHPQIVFHAAAYKHVPLMERTPDLAVLNNVMGTMNIAELSVLYLVKKFVMVSTDKAVNPTNVMGASKRIAEIFTQSLNDHLKQDQHNGDGYSLVMNNGNSAADSLEKSFEENGEIRHTAFITTRFGNVLGSSGSVVPRFKKLIEQGGPVTVTHPDVTRFFMTIPEACQLVLQAAIMGSGGEIFEFDMGTPVKIADLAYKMIRLCGLEPDKDIKVIFTGLRPGEKLYEELLGKEEDVVPTYHKKIMIARVRTYDFMTVKQDIQSLISIARGGDVWKVVEMMKHIVPEYKSNNSVFEKLDAAFHTSDIETPAPQS